jgi:hypothetical protein
MKLFNQIKQMIIKGPVRWHRGLFYFVVAIASLFVALEIKPLMNQAMTGDQQEALVYSESFELTQGIQDLTFSDWKLKAVVIDEPTEWEIKTLEGRGAHLILIEFKRMEMLNQRGLLEKAKIRVPLFSMLSADFRKSDWEKVFLPLFWKSTGPTLKDLSIWGLSVPRNSPDRKLSWKAFYEIAGHPLFKAKLASTNLGLTLSEFEEAPIPAERKASFIRQKQLNKD